MAVVTGTAVAGAVAVSKGAAIWAGIRAGAATVGKFLLANAKPIATGVAAGAVALTGGSFSNGDMKVSYKKGLLDKPKSDSSAQSKSTRTSSAQSKPNNSKPAYNNSNQKSWSHSGTYKKRR